MTKFVGLALLVVFLAACSTAPSEIKLTANDNGKTIEAAANQSLTITLDSNATTGYKWNLVTEPDAKVVKLVSSDYVVPTSDSQPIVGAGGAEVWKFQIIGAGKTTITLAYFRPFDPKQVAKEYTVTIMVK